MRALTILIALLMMTSGMAAMTVNAAPGDATWAVVEGTVAEVLCAEDDSDPECDGVGEPGDTLTENGGQFVSDEAGALLESLPPECNPEAGGSPISPACHDAVDALCQQQPEDPGCIELLPIKVEQDGDVQIITLDAGVTVIVIRADAATNSVSIEQDGETIFDSNTPPDPPGAGGEQHAVDFEYTMTPCDDTDDNHDLDPYCYERLNSGIYVDVDTTPGGDVDDSIIESGTLQSWARIRFDDDAARADEYVFDGELLDNQAVGGANEDAHERASGAFHIGPEICSYTTSDTNDGGSTPNPRCGRTGNLYNDVFGADGRTWDTISEIHIKVPPNNDYARYFIHSDLDDDGHGDFSEINCGSHPLHRESTCDDIDGDGLSNVAELTWASGNPLLDSDGDGVRNLNDRDSDNDGLVDGLEDLDGDGQLTAPGPLPDWNVDQHDLPSDDAAVFYSDLWTRVNIGADLLVGDDVTITRTTTLEPLPEESVGTPAGTVNSPSFDRDPTHRDGKNFDNPFPAHPAERDRHAAMGLETSPLTADTDGDDIDRGRFHEGQRNRDWHANPFHRDPHPVDGLIDNQDVDGDQFLDVCERRVMDPDNAPDGLGTLEVRGSYGTQLHHMDDDDGDGLPNRLDCDLSSNFWDYDTDNDGLDDKEEEEGLLKNTAGRPGGAHGFPVTKSYDPHSDHDASSGGKRIANVMGDGMPDGVEVIGDWSGDTLATRASVKGDCLLGCNALDVSADPIAPPEVHGDVLGLRIVQDVLLQACARQVNGLQELGLVCVNSADGIWSITHVDREALLPFVSDPTSVDGDDDGLWDVEEVTGRWFIERSHCGNNDATCNWQADDPAEEHIKAFLPSNPSAPDSDGDGLWDGAEVKDKDAPPTDGNNGPVNCHDEGGGDRDDDGHDCDGGWNTEPRLVDSDGDGMSDNVEMTGKYFRFEPETCIWEPVWGPGRIVGVGLNCSSVNDRGDPRLWDKDGDGLGDAYELMDTMVRPGPVEAPFDPFSNPARLDCAGGVCDDGFGTRPGLVDTDGDGRDDLAEIIGQEVDHQTLGMYYLGPSDPLMEDDDGDGITDGEEVTGPFFSDPGMLDSDGDELSDRREQYHTSEAECVRPALIEDILDDEIEAEAGMRPFETCDGGYGTDPLLDDSDGDTFSDILEINTGTDPLDPNSWPNGDIDADGLLDAWEMYYFGNLDQDGEGDPDGDGFPNADEYAVFDGTTDDQPFGPMNVPDSDPTDAASTPEDRDGDGMAYDWEVEYFGNEWSQGRDGDPDGDGLTNGFEHDQQYFVQAPADRDPVCTPTPEDPFADPTACPLRGGTDPTNDDTDGDGLFDGDEVNDHGTNPIRKDSDGDALDDDVELDGSANDQYGNEPTDPTSADTDFDGLTDGEEILNGGPDFNGDENGDGETDPNVADTDGDNYNDGLEVDQGTDPLNEDHNPGSELAAAGIPNPLTVLTDSECDFTTPSTWTPQGEPPVNHWDGEACDDTSVPDIVAPLLSEILTELARIQESLDDVDPTDPVHEGLQFSDTVLDFAGRSSADIVEQVQFMDQSDPRDLDGDGDFAEPNGQLDLVERSLVYYDRDEDNDEAVDEFSGQDGYTVTIMHAQSPFGPMASNKALVIRVGDVSGTVDRESLVIEAGDGNDRVTYCLTQDNKEYIAVGWFKDVGCSRYEEAADIAGVNPGFDISDRDRDGVPHTVDNCPEARNPTQDDADGDGIGDVCDGDRDGDDVPNHQDTFPDDGDEWQDSDEDGVGDNGDPYPADPARSADADNDGVAEDGPEPDNCPEDANPDQADLDGDGQGDVCDDDIDGDRFPNDVETLVESSATDPEETPVTKITDQAPTPDEVQEVLDGACAEAELEGTFPDCFVDSVPTPEEAQALVDDTVCGATGGEGDAASCAIASVDGNGNGMPDAIDAEIQDCSVYEAMTPEERPLVFVCRHGGGSGVGTLISAGWPGYFIVVNGRVVAF